MVRHLAACLALTVLFTAACSAQDEWVKPDAQALACDDYATVAGDGSYTLYNNVWNAVAAGDQDWRQCIEREAGERQRIGWSWDWPHNRSDTIFGYPQARYGVSPWDPAPDGGGDLPARLSDLESLRIAHEFTADAAGPFNIAVSMWLTDRPVTGTTAMPAAIRAEVMVWTYYTPDHIAPAGRRIGEIEHAGRTWSVWLDEHWNDPSGVNANSWTYLVFRSENPSLAASFDAAALLRTPLLREYGFGDLYVADVEVGSEVAGGRGQLWLDSLELDVHHQGGTASTPGGDDDG